MSGKSDINVLAAAATGGFTMVSFTEPVSRRNTFVGGTCAPPSAPLVKILHEVLFGHFFDICVPLFKSNSSINMSS